MVWEGSVRSGSMSYRSWVIPTSWYGKGARKTSCKSHLWKVFLWHHSKVCHAKKKGAVKQRMFRPQLFWIDHNTYNGAADSSNWIYTAPSGTSWLWTLLRCTTFFWLRYQSFSHCSSTHCPDISPYISGKPSYVMLFCGIHNIIYAYIIWYIMSNLIASSVLTAIFQHSLFL